MFLVYELRHREGESSAFLIGLIESLHQSSLFFPGNECPALTRIVVSRLVDEGGLGLDLWGTIRNLPPVIDNLTPLIDGVLNRIYRTIGLNVN